MDSRDPCNSQIALKKEKQIQQRIRCTSNHSFTHGQRKNEVPSSSLGSSLLLPFLLLLFLCEELSSFSNHRRNWRSTISQHHAISHEALFFVQNNFHRNLKIKNLHKSHKKIFSDKPQNLESKSSNLQKKKF